MIVKQFKNLPYKYSNCDHEEKVRDFLLFEDDRHKHKHKHNHNHSHRLISLNPGDIETSPLVQSIRKTLPFYQIREWEELDMQVNGWRTF